MCADNGLRARSCGRDLIDIETGSVASKNRAAFANAIKLAENFLLQRHAFKHRFDYHIDASKFTVVQSWPNELEALIYKLLREAAALYGVRVIFLDVGKATIERGPIGLLEEHRNPSVCEHHGDAATHRPRANDAHRLDRNDWRLLRYVRNLRDFALAEEYMNK